MRLLTAQQMREADARAVSRVGASMLMRRAGIAVAEGIRRVAPGARRIVAFAGPGNNGGDAFAALAEMDRTAVRVVYATATAHTSDARADAEARARGAGVLIRRLPSDEAALAQAAGDADVLLDGLLGTGTRSEPDAELALAVRALNAASPPVLAIDIPTGIDATNGTASAATVRARATVTLGAVKLGLVLDPAREFAGTIYLGEIGMRSEEIEGVEGDRYAALDAEAFLALLPRRPEVSDKRSAGAPLVVAGSEQFPGAAVLCALGAARAGAGYVTVATPSAAAPAVRSHLIEQVVVTYDDADVNGVDGLLDLTNHCSACAIGPGLGLGDAMGEIVRTFLTKVELPFVADASAFFHLAKHLELLDGKACVLTPHEREFARLSGEGTVAPGTRVARLRSFVSRTGVTTLLKGPATLIDDGTTMHVNLSGTPALATAGTGDVLTGMIGTLLSQGLAPVDAARAAAFWHGLAGRHAARARKIGVIARDVAEALGASLPTVSRERDAVLRAIEPA